MENNESAPVFQYEKIPMQTPRSLLNSRPNLMHIAIEPNILLVLIQSGAISPHQLQSLDKQTKQQLKEWCLQQCLHNTCQKCEFKPVCQSNGWLADIFSSHSDTEYLQCESENNLR